MVTKLKVQVVSVVLVLGIFGISANADVASSAFSTCGVTPEVYTDLKDLSDFSRTGNFTDYFKNSFDQFTDFHFTIHIPGDEGIPSINANGGAIFEEAKVDGANDQGSSIQDWTVDFDQGKGTGIPLNTFFQISATGFPDDTQFTIHPSTPIPGALILGSLGIGMVGWMGRKKRINWCNCDLR